MARQCVVSGWPKRARLGREVTPDSTLTTTSVPLSCGCWRSRGNHCRDIWKEEGISVSVLEMVINEKTRMWLLRRLVDRSSFNTSHTQRMHEKGNLYYKFSSHWPGFVQHQIAAPRISFRLLPHHPDIPSGKLGINSAFQRRIPKSVPMNVPHSASQSKSASFCPPPHLSSVPLSGQLGGTVRG